MANKKTNSVPEVSVENEIIEEEVKSTPRKQKKTFDQSDGILCRSVTRGLLNIEGQKTGIMYTFNDYGDESEIEYRDLVAEIRARKPSVFDPRIVIEDEDFVAEFSQIKAMYEEKYCAFDLVALLQLPPQKMKSALADVPKSVYSNLKAIAGTMVANGELDSVQKIKMLDEVLGTDLNFATELAQ